MPVNAGINQWTNIGPGGGDVNTLVIDPASTSTVYAGMDSGHVYKSTNGGGNWSAVNTGFANSNVEALAIDPTNTSIIYAGTWSSGVYKSTNGGGNWSAVNTGLSNLYVNALAIDPTNTSIIYAGTYPNGVYKSTNGGGNWSAVNTGLTNSSWVNALAIDPTNTSIIYAGTWGNGVYKSTNGGGNWSPVNTGLLSNIVNALAIDPTNTSTVYAGTIYYGVYKSTDGGAHWSAANTGLPNFLNPVYMIGAIAIDPANTSNVYASMFWNDAGFGIYKSTDGGANWSVVTMSVPFANIRVDAIAIDPANTSIIYAGTDGGVYKSTNEGANWSAVNTGLTDVIVQALAIDPANTMTVYAGTRYGGVYKSTNGGANWGAINTGLTNMYVEALAIDPTNTATIYAGTNGGVYKSTNGGANWGATGLTNTISTLAIDPANTSTVYAGMWGVYKSTDGGANWSAVNTNLGVNALAIDPANTSTVYAEACNGWVYKSTDGGANWSAVNTGFTSLNCYVKGALAIDPTNTSTIYEGVFTYDDPGGVYKSTDGGANWSAVNTGLSNVFVTSLAIDPTNTSTVYAGTWGGVYKSTNGGANWGAINTGLSNLYVNALAIDPASTSTVYAGMWGGVFSYTYVTIADTNPPTTIASPSGGTYSSAQNVTLTCNDGGGSGCQTTDYCLGSGCTPTTVYTGAINISTSTVLRFYSKDNANNSESVKTETYTITIPTITHTITASAGANGSISPSGAVSVNHGASQTFTFTPSTGYHLADVIVDGSSVGAVISYTFNNVITDHTISATFAINTHTITASAGANGSISPSGAVSVNYGASQSFTITPNANYYVADVLVDNVSVGAITSYTFNNVTADHTISASFAINAERVTQAWVNRYNGSSNADDYATDVAVDSAGNVYVTGGSNVYVTGGSEGVCATIKYDSAGNQMWVSRSGEGFCEALAVDSSGNVYVTGRSFPDLITIKYDSNGNELWAKTYLTSGYQILGRSNIGVDVSGNAYVLATEQGANNSSIWAAVIIKYDPNGNILWMRKYEGTYNTLRDSYVDSNGNIYIVVHSSGSFSIVKYNSLGSKLWENTTSGDDPEGIAVDGNGNVYVTTRGITTVKYDTNGQQLWTRTYSNPFAGTYCCDYPADIVVDSLGNVYVTGSGYGAGDTITELDDFITLKYDANGNEQWVRRYDTETYNRAKAISLDATGNLYVTGHAWNKSYTGQEDYRNDYYVTIKYDPSGNQIWLMRYEEHGSPTAIATDQNGNVYVTGGSYGQSTQIDYATIKYSQALIDLPKTGQTTSYASGDDGAIQAGVAWPSPRFTDNGDGTVTDNLTGLVWTKDAGTPTVGACTGGGMNWQQALDYVACLNSNNYLGQNDWRLPNINELESLVDLSRNSTPLSSGHPFANIQSLHYWSSTTSATITSSLYVDMYYGDVYYDGKLLSYNLVWPVRSSGQLAGTVQLPKTGQTASYATGDDGDLQKGVSWSLPRFTDNGNGTVTDNLTGLIWLKNANCFGSKSWNDALSAANNLTDGQCRLSDGSQAGNWRLPNRKELLGLIDRAKYNPALPNDNPFANVQSHNYWSSTTMANYTDTAWKIWMENGFAGGIYKSWNVDLYVWPVRGGTVTTPTDTTPPTTTASPAGGTYTSAQSVTLTANETATIYYTTDGSTPTTGSPVYSSPINISTTTTLKFFARDLAGNSESVKTELYTLNIDTPPSSPTNIEVNNPGVKGQLVITWTKPTDSDFNHIHIYRSTTSGVLGTLIADNLTGIKYIDTNLASQTTYYYTVKAVDNANNESTNTTQYPGTTLDSAPPSVPTNVTATNAGTGGKINLSWTNPTNADFSHIHIYRSTASGSLGSLVYDNITGTGTSKADTGLTNGGTYYYTVRAIDTSDNETINTNQVSATPTAPDMTSPNAVSNVVIQDPATGGKLNISWTNPTDADFAKVRIYRSTTSGVLGSLAYEVTGTSVTDSGLTSNTTYYYTFRTVDTSGNESSNVNQYSGMPTDTVAPEPVKDLTATLLSGGKVKLDWIRSPSEDINYYNIYSDNGTGMINYSSKVVSIQHPTVTWTSGTLTVGTRYKFAIRAEDTAQNEETNTNVVVSVVPVTDPSAGNVSAIIKTPKTGKKIKGNKVTVVAELIMGTIANTNNIRFQYKPVASGTWQDIPSTDPAKFPNPDTTSPYAIEWDITSLSDGNYNLRAVAMSNASVTDGNPPYIVITVDSANPDSEETTNAQEEKVKKENISKNTANNIMMAGSGITKLNIPEGAIESDTNITITISNPASKASLVPSGYGNGNEFREITLESGQSNLSNNKKATIEIPYKDENGDGIVDGTSIKVYDLQVCDYNSGTGTWTCLDSIVDSSNKSVRAKTEKFSLFGLLVPPKPTGTQWNFISIPVQPSPNTPSAVFGSITNYTNYVQMWNPTSQSYYIVSSINVGEGYWIWGNGSNLTVTGTETPNANFSVSIKKGWNMIGHPFRYKVKVSDLHVFYGGSYYTITDAETNGWVVGTVYSYRDGAYQFDTAQDGGVMEAWKGYWILSDIDCTLIIPPTPAQ